MHNALTKKQTKESRVSPKETSLETNWWIIVLAKNYLFKSCDAISAGIFIEISQATREKERELIAKGYLLWSGKYGEVLYGSNGTAAN